LDDGRCFWDECDGSLGLLMLLGMQLNGGRAENPLGSLAMSGRQLLLASLNVFMSINMAVHSNIPTLPYAILFSLGLIMTSLAF